ncbi:MAG: lamin tail domain-containing protein [Ignavibacteriales bacterium]|nr:lamin tail domain-containing protein [Ignavibacteriales bacterium]
MQQQFISQFNLGGLVNLAIGTNLNEGVKVKLNNIEINNFPWDGEYFLNTSVELEAVSKTGIKFVEWVINGNVKINDPQTTLTLTENTISIEAIFETDILSDNSIVINEINYNSSTELNSKDWIELANISDSEIDISGWNFKDQNDDNNYEIPMNTILKSKEYIVLSEDTTAVKRYFFGSEKLNWKF